MNAAEMDATGAAKAASFLRFAAKRAAGDGISRMAASLSYTSLLSLVPLLAIALAMLAAFPAFDSVREDLVGWAFRTFAPSIGEVVQFQIQKFVDNAGRLSAVGILSLAVTAIMLLVTIEGTLNAVFRVTKARSALSKLLVYWTFLTLGPLLMGAALSLQGYVAALQHLDFARSAAPVFSLPLPTILTGLAFMGMFAAIPNRRVRIRDAAIGAAVSAIMFAGLRWGFGLYITSSGTYANLYGAVAVIPVFLLWTFLSWLVILIGAEITAALPEWRGGLHLALEQSRSARRLTLALEVLTVLSERARDGEIGATRKDLLARTACSERDLNRLLNRLMLGGFTTPTTRKRMVLSRDLTQASLGDLIRILDLEPSLDDSVALNADWRAKAETLIGLAKHAAAEPYSVPLSNILYDDHAEGRTATHSTA